MVSRAWKIFRGASVASRAIVIVGAGGFAGLFGVAARPMETRARTMTSSAVGRSKRAADKLIQELLILRKLMNIAAKELRSHGTRARATRWMRYEDFVLL